MLSRAMKIKAKRNANLEISIIPGHFATIHSHINYYIDLTAITCHQKIAEIAGEELASKYFINSPIDTIICMDGTEIVGAFLAHELSKQGTMSMNSGNDINLITPEFNSNGQMIFRDNLQGMIWNKNVLLLVASATTGKTIRRAVECIHYYSGRVEGVSALFSAIDEIDSIPIDSIFNLDDIPEYKTYSQIECPQCQSKQKIDALVNSYGYSKI